MFSLVVRQLGLDCSLLAPQSAVSACSGRVAWPEEGSGVALSIQGGQKVRRQTATTHGGGLGESFEVGNPCPETHRYAPVSTFLERMNVRLVTSHSSGQRARSGMRFSFVSFHAHAVCLRSSVVPYWP